MPAEATTVEFTYDEDTYSDLHKDVYGFRPRDFGTWNSMTPAEKQVEWDRLIVLLDEEINRQRQEEVIAAEVFEARVTATIVTGAADRETALRWIYQADIGDDGFQDWDFLCYHNGLRYGYFANANGK